jgi:hypothetical protein
LGIEAYFQRLREVIDTSPIVSAFNVTYDKRASHEGFIRGEIYFIDGSILHLHPGFIRPWLSQYLERNRGSGQTPLIFRGQHINR